MPAAAKQTETQGAALEALGNPVRREILDILSGGPLAVGEIAERLPVSRPAVSKHLRVLERGRLVAHEPDGTRNLFRLDPGGFEAARAWIDQFWNEGLARFKLLAENTAPRPRRRRAKP